MKRTNIPAVEESGRILIKAKTDIQRIILNEMQEKLVEGKIREAVEGVEKWLEALPSHPWDEIYEGKIKRIEERYLKRWSKGKV